MAEVVVVTKSNVGKKPASKKPFSRCKSDAAVISFERRTTANGEAEQSQAPPPSSLPLSHQDFELDKKRRQSLIEIVQEMDYTGRVLPVVRTVHMFLQTLNAVLICLGVSRIEDRVVFLSIQRWQFRQKDFQQILETVPPQTFYYFSVNWQYAALFAVTAYALHNLVCVLAQINHKPLNRNLCVFVAFFGVPLMALLFYTELHYSWCPWLDDYYRKTTRGTAMVTGKDGQTRHIHCNAFGWLASATLAAVCAFLLIVDGLITLNLGHQQRFPSKHSLDSNEENDPNDPVSHILDSLQY